MRKTLFYSWPSTMTLSVVATDSQLSLNITL